jgi:two-component system, chemotaxis family, response regulator WspF
MRIAIVNALPPAVDLLRRVIASLPEHTLAWVAVNGLEAVEKCRRDRPDLILMDLALPALDGIQATGRIMKESPCAILIVTATVEGNAAGIFEAMGRGALDVVATPVPGPGNDIGGSRKLIKKIVTIEKFLMKSPPPPQAAAPERQGGPQEHPPLVAIGASTGGPKALADLLSGLPANLGAALIVVQHVDAHFGQGLASWLDSHTPLKVEAAREGMRPTVDTVLIAVTDDHLVLGADLALHYTPEPKDYPYRPSVNAFFLSLVRHWPRRDVAALLTGMGRDGAQGLAALRKAGWHTIAQDQKSSVVYGMPAAAAELNAAVEILPVGRIAAAIRRRIEQATLHTQTSRKDP